jgi:hypothetical protein
VFWLLIVLGAVVFGVFFGGAFVFAGARRVLRARDEPRPVDARLWGSIGVLVGLGLITYAAWLAWGRLVPHA